MAEKQVKYDLDGYNVVTTALLALLNQYPGLNKGEKITFSVLGEDSGIAMFPISGAVIETEKKFITGRTEEVCLYPFYIIYRAGGLSSGNKATVKEWLDNLGRWLEKENVIINGTEYKLSEYPPLTENRKFLSISRQTPSYLDTVNENKSENWAIYISARYQHNK